MFRHVTPPPTVHCQEQARTRPVHVTNTERNVLHRREVQGRWEERSFLQVNNVTMGGGGAHLHYSKKKNNKKKKKKNSTLWWVDIQ